MSSALVAVNLVLTLSPCYELLLAVSVRMEGLLFVLLCLIGDASWLLSCLFARKKVPKFWRPKKEEKLLKRRNSQAKWLGKDRWIGWPDAGVVRGLSMIV